MHPLCFCSVEYIKVLSFRLYNCKLGYAINACTNKNSFLIVYKIFRVMIIDLDAHQGNGHEMDFAYDSMAKKFLLLLFDFKSLRIFTNRDFGRPSLHFGYVQPWNISLGELSAPRFVICFPLYF